MSVVVDIDGDPTPLEGAGIKPAVLNRLSWRYQFRRL
jgi:hypothetical protein